VDDVLPRRGEIWLSAEQRQEDHHHASHGLHAAHRGRAIVAAHVLEQPVEEAPDGHCPRRRRSTAR
jgi:hypothetical protein